MRNEKIHRANLKRIALEETFAYNSENKRADKIMFESGRK